MTRKWEKLSFLLSANTLRCRAQLFVSQVRLLYSAWSPCVLIFNIRTFNNCQLWFGFTSILATYVIKICRKDLFNAIFEFADRIKLDNFGMQLFLVTSCYVKSFSNALAYSCLCNNWPSILLRLKYYKRRLIA